MGCAPSTSVLQSDEPGSETKKGAGGSLTTAQLLNVSAPASVHVGAHAGTISSAQAGGTDSAPTPGSTTGGEIIIYGNQRCGWCAFVREDLASAGITFRFANVDDDATSSEMWAKAEEAGFGLDGTIGLPIVDVDGVIQMRPSSNDVLAILRSPQLALSSCIRQFRSAVNRLHAVHRVTLAKRAFNPVILPGVSGPEDEEELRAMMAEMVGFDNAIRDDLEVAQQAVEQEKAQQAKRHETQLAQRTEKAAEKLHGNQGAPTAAVAAGAATVSAVVRWTNRAVIAHEKAVAEANLAANAEAQGDAKGEVIIYGRDTCGWCNHVAAEFSANGIAFRKVDIDDDAGSAEMWQKVSTNPAIGNSIGLPVVDVFGNICIRPTAEEVLAITRTPAAANTAENTGVQDSCVGDDCTIISHEDGSREGGKPPLLSLEAALALTPITNFYGVTGPQDERLAIYGAFTEMNCKLHWPTRGPLVTGVPFQLCLVAGTDVEEVGVLADGEFPVVACLKPKKVENGMNVFFGEMLIATEASDLTFYNVTHGEGGCSSLQGLFEWTGCITRSAQLAGSSSKASELEQATAKTASGDLDAAIEHLNTALVYDSADAAVLVQRAEVQLSRKLYDKAVTDATLALKADAALLDAWKIVAQAEFSRGCYNACVEACESAPDSVELKELLTEVDTERWVECDQRATECPEDPEIVGSIESLAKYLTEPFETDVEKHRVIFRWVADHISYNAKALQTGNYEVIPGVDPFSPEGVLQARTGVCSAYSRLYKGLTDVVGIETVCCSGYTYSCKKPGATPKSSHEWNCIKIDGVWTPCDSTWAAGSVGGDFQFSKHYDDFWWMVLPHQFIYTHLCEDPQWTCLPADAVPSVSEFQEMLDLKGDFFGSGLELISHEKNTIVKNSQMTEVTLRETGERQFIIASLDGKNLVTKFDQTTRVHTVELTGRGKKLSLFFSKQEFGSSYSLLVEYNVT